MPKKKSRNLANLDPIERLVIQQKQQEQDVSASSRGNYAKQRDVGDPDFNYRGPTGYQGGILGHGSLDRMPGTTGYTYTEPNTVEYLLDLLKIKKFQPKLNVIKGYRNPNPMEGAI